MGNDPVTTTTRAAVIPAPGAGKIMQLAQVFPPPATPEQRAVGAVGSKIVTLLSAEKKLSSPEATKLNTTAVTTAEKAIAGAKSDPASVYTMPAATRSEVREGFKKLEDFMPDVYKNETQKGRSFVEASKHFESYSKRVEALSGLPAPTADDRRNNLPSVQTYDKVKSAVDYSWSHFEASWRKYYSPSR